TRGCAHFHSRRPCCRPHAGLTRRKGESGGSAPMTVLRRFGPSIKMLFAHKVRFTLTIASVAVGVAAGVITGAIGTGAQQGGVRKTASMGTHLLVVGPAQGKNPAGSETV